MKVQIKDEQGFTLVEVLAAILTLSIVSLLVVSYFMNAHTYAKSNQNKTVMVNLARNALFYMEKQDFSKMEEYFTAEDGTVRTIEGSSCTAVDTCAYSSLFTRVGSLPGVLNPKVNNVQYELVISYQKNLREQLDEDTSGLDQLADRNGNGSLASYLIPVKVTVIGPGGPRAKESEVVVEGYITDEKIR